MSLAAASWSEAYHPGISDHMDLLMPEATAVLHVKRAANNYCQMKLPKDQPR